METSLTENRHGFPLPVKYASGFRLVRDTFCGMREAAKREAGRHVSSQSKLYLHYNP